MAKTWGMYVTVLYLVTKLLYIVNVIAQFLILNAFLGPNYTWWGFGILRDILSDHEWEQSGHFPRVGRSYFTNFHFHFYIIYYRNFLLIVDLRNLCVHACNQFKK